VTYERETRIWFGWAKLITRCATLIPSPSMLGCPLTSLTMRSGPRLMPIRRARWGPMASVFTGFSPPPTGRDATAPPGRSYNAPMQRSGRGVRCLACGRRFAAFLRYGLRPRPGRCPGCGSKPRHRGLLVFLRRFVRPRLRDGSEVLEIGPSRPATRFVPRRRTIGPARYTAIDLDHRPHHARLRRPHRFRRMDATCLRFREGTFDVILCNNVLPFAADDTGILREIRRCLKPDGVAMVDVDVQVAWTTAAATLRRRDPERFTAEYVGTNGSHRFYGRDYPGRLRQAGLAPLRFDALQGLRPAFRRVHGLKADGRVYLAFATPRAATAFARAARARLNGSS
jgi:SAM-dependent methyltransferase